jgi:hypothetical protein
MAQTNWGPAEPIRQVGVRAYRAVSRANQATSPQRKQDTSWHDSAVRKANESFRDAAKRKSAKRSSARKSFSRSASRSSARSSSR